MRSWRGIRERYPDWRLLVDGDGGDENLKDYPIEENAELTIRSVVNNRMLYQEGWGVRLPQALARLHGRLQPRLRPDLRQPAAATASWASAPSRCPPVVAVAEAIPFADLTCGSTERLYALKGEIVARGVSAVFGVDMPVFPKRRFQDGAAPMGAAPHLYAAGEAAYRSRFLARYQA